jgi:mRNA interferase HigB
MHKGSHLRVISKKKLRDYYHNNAQAELPLAEWYYKIKICNTNNISELRKVFNNVDAVHGYTVFNIGGNNYRLITAVHYNTQLCYIRTCWTHAEYSKKDSQDKLKRGDL